ncbi:MAG: GNAT family N-acetyltransferase [Bacteroidetes bacterium]|nr:GNAT family N-acetyltransferase [Bacteroidota bacterium]
MKAIQFRTGTAIPFHQVLSLYDNAGWTAYTSDSETLQRAIQQSLFVITAWDETQLVGLLRAVGDGETIVYVQDILVLKSYRRQSIGRQLLNHVLDKYLNVRQIVLMTDHTSDTTSFYESCGFTKTEHLQLQTFIRLKTRNG